MSNTARKLEPSLTPLGAPKEQLEALERLSELLRSQAAGAGLEVVFEGGTRRELPESVAVLLARVVETLASGESIALVPVSQELTTQQAADLLNISRQYLVRQLEQGVLPYRMTGTHRRLRLEDVLAYKAEREMGRRKALDELSELTQAFGGYTELDGDD